MDSNPIDFSKIQKVLVAKLRHHGDVLLASPVFSLLKSRFPHLQVDAYIYHETLPMLEGHPAISEFLLYDKKWKNLPIHRRYLEEFKLLKKIRRGGYDLVVNLTEGDRGAIAARISKCSYAVGFDPQGQGMKGKRDCYTHVIKHTPRPRHTVEKQLDALRCLGIFPEPHERDLYFHLSEEDQEAARKKLLASEVKPGEYVLVHPVSRWMFKTLPASKIAEVIRFLHERGEKVVLTASPDPIEQAMNEEICRLVPEAGVVNLSGQISLKELGVLIRDCRMLISVDSVPVHLASVFKTPVVAIFGPTCEKNWGPYLNPNSRIVAQPVSCRPCYQPGCGGSGQSDCLRTLSSKKIIEAAADLLDLTTVQNLLQSK